MQSESIKELAMALSIVQSKIRGAKLDSENPFFKSKYADLTAVWQSCRESLTKNGLAVIQTMEYEPSHDVNLLKTTLAHVSGEWISGSMAIQADKPGPQGQGSAITYARRYSLAAIVGIAPEGDDDDAEGATDRTKKASAPSRGTGVTKTIVPTDLRRSDFKGKAWFFFKDIDGGKCYTDVQEVADVVQSALNEKQRVTAVGVEGPKGFRVSSADLYDGGE